MRKPQSPLIGIPIRCTINGPRVAVTSFWRPYHGYEAVRAKRTYLLTWMSRKACTSAFLLFTMLALGLIPLAQDTFQGSAVEFVRDVVPILRDK